MHMELALLLEYGMLEIEMDMGLLPFIQKTCSSNSIQNSDD